MSEQNLRNLVIEIGTEEIPARMMTNALNTYQTRANEWMDEKKIDGDFRVFGTPRRLVFYGGVSPTQREWTETEKGPPVDVAFDDGEPTEALQGFCGQHDIDPNQVIKRSSDGGEYVFAEITHGGSPVQEVLESSFPNVISDYSWPKSMRWESTQTRFVRPIRWILAYLDETQLDIKIGPVESGSQTCGLRFTENETVDVESASEYISFIDDSSEIWLNHDERQGYIQEEAERLADDVDASPVYDKELIQEVTHLVEAPTPFRGSFDSDFLKLPDPVLSKTMQSHQKYFPVRGEDGLRSYFIGVRNGADEHLQTVKTGNEKVLRARLSDAEFFYEKDLKRAFESYRGDLKGVVYQEELGSLFDKTERVAEILTTITNESGELPDIARHCKNDLVTDMVEEFPSLQGTMGRIYATESGWNDERAQILEEYYKPEDREDEIPNSTPAQLLSLVDRIDTLLGFFGLGKRPTGSSDPFGLRRDALAVIRILLSDGCEVSGEIGDIMVLINAVYKQYNDTGFTIDEETLDDLNEFFEERLVYFAKSSDEHFKGAPENVRWQHAALMATIPKFWNRPLVAEERYDWITGEWILNKSDEFEDVIEVYQRVDNIVSEHDVPDTSIDSDRFEEDVEETLLQSVTELRAELDKALEAKNADRIFAALHEYVDPINQFFETVMVMAEDPEVKVNRLRLLSTVKEQFDRIADFSVF